MEFILDVLPRIDKADGRPLKTGWLGRLAGNCGLAPMLPYAWCVIAATSEDWIYDFFQYFISRTFGRRNYGDRADGLDLFQPTLNSADTRPS
jgi:hypothetical protein